MIGCVEEGRADRFPREGFADTERFRIVRELGAGGMGVVYEAIDTERDERVAIKTLRRLDAQALYRFKNEFRALVDLHHPNLVRLGELIEDAGRWFFTMELLDGVDFLTYVRGRAAAPAEHDTLATTVVPVAQAPTLSPGSSSSSPAPALPFDEDKLRAALGQLVLGVATIHEVGKIHRDLKPSNTCVMADGRLVILDLGLVTGVARPEQSTDVRVVGTIAYMAPEQAASLPVEPAADWYSVGVMLYEALTGKLPHEGAPLEVLMNKQKFEPPPPRAIVPGVPRDLDELCAELLRFEPGARPDEREIRSRLGVELEGGLLAASSTRRPSTPSLIGRDDELAQLEERFGIVQRGEAATVVVEGESGVGKSALVAQFTASLQADAPDVVVLAGRCYERESVPYKAFDGVVDALARYMMHLDDADANALLPRDTTLLGEAFPVLRRVRAVAAAPIPRTKLPPDPQERRGRLLTSLRPSSRRRPRWPTSSATKFRSASATESRTCE